MLLVELEHLLEHFTIYSWCKMTGVEYVKGKQFLQRAGNDAVYGNGSDGNGYVNSTVTLTSDMYYNNLEITSSGVVLTNGFRVFVKGTLTLNGHIGMGSVSSGTVGESASDIPDGTVAGNTTSTITYRIGGQGGGGSNPGITTLPAFLYKNIDNLTGGIFADPTNGFIKIGGGSRGSTGSTGTVTPARTTWPNKTGKAGSAGGYAPSAHTVNAPGGRGNPAADGNTNSSSAPGGAGGAGGAGGGVVAIFAKTIVGSGKVISIGRSGASGSVGTTIPAGSTGASGAKAPDRTDHFHVAPGHAHEPHTSNHNPHTSSHAPHTHARNHDHHNHTTKHSDRHGHAVKPHSEYKGHHYEGPHWHHGGHYHHPHNDGPHGGVHHWDGHYWHAWRPHYNNAGHWAHYPPHGHQKPNGHHNWYQPDGNAHHHERIYHGSFGGHDGHVHAHFGQPAHTHTHAGSQTSSSPRYHHHNHITHHNHIVHHHTGPASHRSHANPDSYNPAHHYVGGAGGVNDGSHGQGAPAITGGTGKRGGAGGGGAIVIICDTIDANIAFDTRAGLTSDADNFSASQGSSYILYNI